MNIEYIVIEKKVKSEFEEEVSVHLGDGWILAGGVAVDEGYYHQAMYKAYE